MKEIEKYKIDELDIREKIASYKTSIYHAEIALRERSNEVL